MEVPNEQPKLWSNVQAYVLSVVCLILGVATGYLLHGPSTPGVGGPAMAPQQMMAQGAMPQVTPDQLKHMADKKAEPLLAELQKNPNDALLLARIGGIYLSARQFDAAGQYFQRSAAAKPDPKVLSALSYSYYNLGDTDKAIASLDRALQVDPKYPDALYSRGMLHWRVKTDPKAAIADWEKLIRTNPDYPNRAQVEQLIARAKLHLKIPAGTKTDKPAM